MKYRQNSHSNNIKMGPKSILDHPDRVFLGRIARQSTIGRSSRIYYRNGEGVPFKWEEEPGKAIEPQPNGALPPLSPPPAFLSSALPKPNIVIEDDIKEAPMRRMWKRFKKMVKKRNKDISEAIEEVFKREKIDSSVIVDEKVVEAKSCGGDEESYLWKFDGEQMRLTPRSSVPSPSLSSSSNSMLSSSSSLASKALPMEDPGYSHSNFTCGPRNFGEFMLCLIKRSS